MKKEDPNAHSLKAYLKDQQLHLCFSSSWSEQEILSVLPLGQGIGNFIAADERQIASAFQAAKFTILKHIMGKCNSGEMCRQFDEFFLPLARTNPYLFFYLDAYIETLLEYMERSEDTSKLLLENAPLEDALTRQKELKEDLNLLFFASTDDLSPLQRLYKLSETESLSSNYAEAVFQYSLQPAFTEAVSDAANANASAKAKAKTKVSAAGSVQIVEMYEPEDSEAVLRFELIQMLLGSIIVKACKYCGGYFIPDGRSDTEYCNRPVDGTEKTCREIGPALLFKEKHFGNEIHKMYRTAYSRMDSRKRQGMISREDFFAFSEAARTKRDACMNGDITPEEFQAWLDETKRS